MRALILAVVLAGGSSGATMVEMKVLHRELPNLVFQLDCVSGAIGSCSLEAYQPVWNAKFLTSPEDAEALKLWKTTRARYGESVEIHSEVKYPLGRTGSKLSLDASVRRAGLLATSVDDLVSRLDLLMLAADRDAMASVLRRFGPRFHTWYQAQAKSGDAFALELQRLLERQDMQTLINQFHAFYDAQLSPNRPLPFLVLDRPESANPRSFAEQVGGVSLIEVAKGEKATSRIDVVIHELCHYLFTVSRPQTIVTLQNRFLSSKVLGRSGPTGSSMRRSRLRSAMGWSRALQTGRTSSAAWRSLRASTTTPTSTARPRRCCR